MSDKIPDAMSAHQIEDPAQVELFELLQKHCGEEIGGVISIDSDRAVLLLFTSAAQLMAQWSRRRRESLLKEFSKATDNLSARIKQQYAARESGVPQ